MTERIRRLKVASDAHGERTRRRFRYDYLFKRRRWLDERLWRDNPRSMMRRHKRFRYAAARASYPPSSIKVCIVLSSFSRIR
jgi:hypothetical protein